MSKGVIFSLVQCVEGGRMSKGLIFYLVQCVEGGRMSKGLFFSIAVRGGWNDVKSFDFLSSTVCGGRKDFCNRAGCV